MVVVEDLHSANGTFVAGQRIQQATVRPGDEVLFGRVTLPWAHASLRPFLRLGASGTRVLPRFPLWKKIGRYAGWGALGLLGVIGFTILVLLPFPGGRQWLRDVGERMASWVHVRRLPQSDQEAYIRSHLASGVRDAIDPNDPKVRDTAVKIAAKEQGTFKVEQVAAIWQFVREHWKYVNDPRGREYFSTAKATISNEFAGDCDDFAITLVAMVGAIGGEARVIFMEGPQGGHAYAEACIQQLPTTVASELSRYYARSWSRYTRQAPRQIAFRASSECKVWLNLDWFSNVPGGDYQSEQWAVAIYPDGNTETLTPAAGAAQQRNVKPNSTVEHLATPPVTP